MDVIASGAAPCQIPWGSEGQCHDCCRPAACDVITIIRQERFWENRWINNGLNDSLLKMIQMLIQIVCSHSTRSVNASF